ncbi:MAG: YggS family pyridoxal phosphate-dependent enzyme [Erysipelotrichaceae bacterium]|nr:YggS family pyridoxal phosphate-dependent enzyme [Erysipelotrichaceae bacterium]MDD3808959.1 YggS family pyridoxal phosphate-dependent enzyme [Erysipelotrichaceae bacterium]
MIVNENMVKQLLEELGDRVLVAATKYVDVEQIEELERIGVTHFGENRVQALLEKYDNYHGKGSFEFIGTLQKNKVKYIIDKVSLIHSIDSLGLLQEVDKQAKKHNLIMPVLIQVNIAKEETKHGFSVLEMDDIFLQLDKFTNIEVRGLMMMAPNIDPVEAESYFEATQQLLVQLNDKFNMEMTELSMGMSNDYREAMKHGATRIRIGRALFTD